MSSSVPFFVARPVWFRLECGSGSQGTRLASFGFDVAVRRRGPVRVRMLPPFPVVEGLLSGLRRAERTHLCDFATSCGTADTAGALRSVKRTSTAAQTLLPASFRRPPYRSTPWDTSSMTATSSSSKSKTASSPISRSSSSTRGPEQRPQLVLAGHEVGLDQEREDEGCEEDDEHVTQESPDRSRVSAGSVMGRWHGDNVLGGAPSFGAR